MGGPFHVVCHECLEEGIYDERDAAVAVRDEHEESTGHRVSLADIARPTPNA